MRSIIVISVIVGDTAASPLHSMAVETYGIFIVVILSASDSLIRINHTRVIGANYQYHCFLQARKPSTLLAANQTRSPNSSAHQQTVQTIRQPRRGEKLRRLKGDKHQAEHGRNRMQGRNKRFENRDGKVLKGGGGFSRHKKREIVVSRNCGPFIELTTDRQRWHTET